MIDELLDVLLPAPCLACGKPPKPLCQNCQPAFTIIEDGERHFYAAELDQELGLILSAVKDRNRTAVLNQIARSFRPCLAHAIEKTRPTLLVCPPSSAKNFRKRGFNPALWLLKAANPSTIRATDRALRLVRQPRDQRGLDQQERSKNVDNLFQSQIREGRVLLVDDVKTTGATLKSMQSAFERAGVEVVGSCVLAKRN